VLTTRHRLAVAAVFAAALVAHASEPAPAGMARIGAGIYRPLFAGGNAAGTRVKSFYLDVLPVTNEEFLEFVRANPAWRRSQVPRAWADESYLKNWAGDLDPGTNAPPRSPVTSVSWFAANACAQWQGKRLPSTAEWERAAAASPSRADGAGDPAFLQTILQWYSEPSGTRPGSVGAGLANFWGVRDLHGLVWEWVADFTAASGEAGNKNRGATERFCGAGGAGARDLQDFPAFMRNGLRSSLKANYCLRNLGFRCAKDE
jgi:sulfatase modifying factor 1